MDKINKIINQVKIWSTNNEMDKIEEFMSLMRQESKRRKRNELKEKLRRLNNLK